MSETTTLEFLIPYLRVYMGDLAEPQRYTDEVLLITLISAVRMLNPRWNAKYLLNENDEVYRNASRTYNYESPPLIQDGDQGIILLQAAIILKTASAQGSVWDIASWRDNEISYSNIESGRMMDRGIARDLKLLEDLLNNRLAGATLQSLPGFHLPNALNEGSL